jgi:hypothetical protein
MYNTAYNSVACILANVATPIPNNINPICPIALYPISRLNIAWLIPPILAITILKIALPNTKNCKTLSHIPKNGPNTKFIRTVNNAILGTVAKYPVTIVGEPS